MRNRNQELIAQRIRELRGDRTQNEVAEVLHITQSYLSELERGKKVPSKALLLDRNTKGLHRRSAVDV